MKARHLFAATVVVLAGLAAPSAAAAQSADPTGVETTLKTSAHPKHHGRIRLKQVPTQLTMETIGDYRVHLSRWLRHQTLQLQYQGPKGRWRKVVDVEAAGRALVSFQAVVPGTVGGVSVGFRFVTLGSRRIAKATSKVWRIPVYRTFPLAQLTPVSGSLVVTSEVGGGQYVAPAGSGPTVTSTLALPENCGRISFSLFVRPDLVPARRRLQRLGRRRRSHHLHARPRRRPAVRRPPHHPAPASEAADAHRVLRRNEARAPSVVRLQRTQLVRGGSVAPRLLRHRQLKGLEATLASAARPPGRPACPAGPARPR